MTRQRAPLGPSHAEDQPKVRL